MLRVFLFFLLLLGSGDRLSSQSFHPARRDVLLQEGSSTATILGIDPDGGAAIAVLADDEDGTLMVVHVNLSGEPVLVWTGSCGGVPNDILSLDLDDNSLPDLVVALREEGVIRSFQNTGGYQYSPLQEISTGSSPSLIRTADILGDETLEVLVTSGSRLLIFTRSAGGLLTEFARFRLRGPPVDFETGDFNGDGASDVVISFGGDGTYLYLGEGDGGVLEVIDIGDDFPGIGDIRGLETADIDNDGHRDILVIDGDGAGYHVLWGDGEGHFPSFTRHHGEPLTNAVIGQVDGVGLLDILSIDTVLGHVRVDCGAVCGVAVPDGGIHGEVRCRTRGAPSTVPSYCFIQRGEPYRCGQETVWADVGDFDADGTMDLFALNRQSGTLSVFRGRGNGCFHTARSYPVGPVETGMKSVAVLDANEDGHDDVAVAYRRVDGVAVLLGDGEGELVFHDSFPIGGEGTHTLDTGDLNGDGHEDLAVRSVSSAEVSVLLGDGTGDFELLGEFPTDAGTHLVEIVDIDLDGHLDVVTPNSIGGTITILLGDGTGMLSPQEHIAVGSRPHSVAAIDFDNDGEPDLATANTGEDSVTVLRNSGGVLEVIGKVEVGYNPISICAGDFDEDGFDDLATANIEGFSLSVLLGDGTGSFERTADDLIAGRAPHFVVAFDMDGDGHLDLVSPVTGMDGVALFFGDGTGGFPRREHYGVDDNPNSIAIGDFNGDLLPDAVTANVVSSNITLLLNALGGPANLPK